MTLFNVKVGEKVAVAGYTLSAYYRKKLAKFGITDNCVITVLGVSPFGGTQKVSVNGVNFAVGKKISEGIMVKYV